MVKVKNGHDFDRHHQIQRNTVNLCGIAHQRNSALGGGLGGHPWSTIEQDGRFGCLGWCPSNGAPSHRPRQAGGASFRCVVLNTTKYFLIPRISIYSRQAHL